MSALRPIEHVRAAAFASAASLAVFVFIQQFAGAILQAFPGIFVPLAVVWDLALWAWILGVAVTVFGSTQADTGWIRLARGAALVALVSPALLGYGQLTGSFATLVPIAYLVIFVTAGVAMAIANIDAHRMRTRSGGQAGLGAFAGAAYVLGGMGGIGLIGTPLFVALAAVGLQVLMLAHASYVAWALWLGARSRRATTPELALA